VGIHLASHQGGNVYVRRALFDLSACLAGEIPETEFVEFARQRFFVLFSGKRIPDSGRISGERNGRTEREGRILK
jgi:hypothetical protein